MNGGFSILPTGSTDPLPPLSLQEAVIQRLNSPNPCGFICTVGWSVGLDIALTFLDLQKAIAHIVRRRRIESPSRPVVVLRAFASRRALVSLHRQVAICSAHPNGHKAGQVRIASSNAPVLEEWFGWISHQLCRHTRPSAGQASESREPKPKLKDLGP